MCLIKRPATLLLFPNPLPNLKNNDNDHTTIIMISLSLGPGKILQKRHYGNNNNNNIVKGKKKKRKKERKRKREKWTGYKCKRRESSMGFGLVGVSGGGE